MYRGMAHAGCEGAAQDQSSCPSHPCPTWADWGEWSECTATCGQGNQHRYLLYREVTTGWTVIDLMLRTRTCENGSDCPGSNREIRFCQLASCPYWDEWMPWSGCSVTCGIGVCERRRKCVTDDLLNLPNLEELDEALFEVESGQADRAKSMLIARSKSKGRNFASRNQSVEDAARRAPSRTMIEGGGSCIGSDVERKPCDADVMQSITPIVPVNQRVRRHSMLFQTALVSDCECMGFSSEDEHCDSMETTTKVINEVDFSVSKANSESRISTDDETRLDENIQSALKVDESSQNRNEVSLTASVIKTEKCEWTRWSQWSTCTVSCGTGERLRKRRCSCGDNQCGAGTDQETTKCSEWKCDRKMPPVFKID
ncbi:thrombospondin type 1 domain protein [Oesophagostomum dentatum]|uniref:Thrombospondin type 1 domain protein n=1 Tax=Oesophagostomum dentatum TaxID=61180 RepID=A0A0B1T3H1_OESDE|nr:thrombospondin type 1 domain protein [Oesophagostomum dentatum]